MFQVKYRYVFVALLGTYSYLNILFTGGDQLVRIPLSGTLLFFIVVGLVLLVWESNRLLQVAVSRASLGRVHPLIVHFGLSLVVSVAIAVAPLMVLHVVSPFADDLSWNTMKLSIGFTSRINLFLHCVNAIVFYMDKYKQAQVEAEHLKIQSMEARFDALRNQINPHFLFNSLNVLSTLVYKDPDTSARFIEQLSNVYRYLLFNQDQKLIPLSEELEFLNSYIFLLKIRFQENLHVDIRIQDQYKDRYIAPSTLQLLIENAIKHNIVSKREPLTIRIFSENGQTPARLVIQNNLQPKESREPSARLGLKNIQSRYDFLAGKEAVQISKDDHFTVKIPLLEIVVK